MCCAVVEVQAPTTSHTFSSIQISMLREAELFPVISIIYLLLYCSVTQIIWHLKKHDEVIHGQEKESLMKADKEIKCRDYPKKLKNNYDKYAKILV